MSNFLMRVIYYATTKFAAKLCLKFNKGRCPTLNEYFTSINDSLS